MSLTPLAVADLVLVAPARFEDARGDLEVVITPALGARLRGWAPFVQVNRARSRPGVLRGLHAQRRLPQGKLVSALSGAIFDVAVDLRAGSPTWGRWAGARLEAGGPAMWIPPGFAHGFYVLEGPAEVLYLVTRPWDPGSELTLAWDDPEVGVDWPLSGPPVLSERDAAGAALRDLEPL